MERFYSNSLQPAVFIVSLLTVMLIHSVASDSHTYQRCRYNGQTILDANKVYLTSDSSTQFVLSRISGIIASYHLR